MATFFKNKMMFWLFLTQKKANKEKTVMTLTAELTFQKILSSIELDSDCVVLKLFDPHFSSRFKFLSSNSIERQLNKENYTYILISRRDGWLTLLSLRLRRNSMVI